MLYFDTLANAWWKQRGSTNGLALADESPEDLRAWRDRLEHLREKTMAAIADRQRIIDDAGPAPAGVDTWVEEERAEVDDFAERLNEIDAELRTLDDLLRSDDNQ